MMMPVTNFKLKSSSVILPAVTVVTTESRVRAQAARWCRTVLAKESADSEPSEKQPRPQPEAGRARGDVRSLRTAQLRRDGRDLKSPFKCGLGLDS